MTPRPQLRVVDEHGEVHDECPSCVQYERQIRTLNARLTRLERDEREESERHKLWDEAAALHDWWALATWHPKAKFDHQDFKDMLPRLKEKKVGAIGVLQGIAGAAFDCGERPMPSGRTERYDSLELICRSAKKLENFQQRVPGDPEGHAWKRWLIEQIEGNLCSHKSP